MCDARAKSRTHSCGSSMLALLVLDLYPLGLQEMLKGAHMSTSYNEGDHTGSSGPSSPFPGNTNHVLLA